MTLKMKGHTANNKSERLGSACGIVGVTVKL